MISKLPSRAKILWSNNVQRALNIAFFYNSQMSQALADQLHWWQYKK